MKIIKENKNVEKITLNKKSSSINVNENEDDKLFNNEALLPSKMKFDNFRKEREMIIFNFNNNSSVCNRFGQVNTEKALILLTIQMILTALIIYYYIHNIEKVMIYLYVISSLFDAILVMILIYYIVKFRQDEIFSQFSRGLSNLFDIINSIDLIFKTLNFSIVFFLSDELSFFFCFWFSFKFILDFYFTFITLKIFVFCSCTLWINEKLYKLGKWIQYYLLCCEVEEKEEYKEPEKIDELESNY